MDMKKMSYEAPVSEFTTFEMGDIIATYGEVSGGGGDAPEVPAPPYGGDSPIVKPD